MPDSFSRLSSAIDSGSIGLDCMFSSMFLESTLFVVVTYDQPFIRPLLRFEPLVTELRFLLHL